MQETWVWSLGQEAPLEKEMATHSSIFAWELQWTEEPGGLQPMGLQRVGHNLATKQQLYLFTKFLSAFPHKLFLIAEYYSAVEAQGEFFPLSLNSIYMYIYKTLLQQFASNAV